MAGKTKKSKGIKTTVSKKSPQGKKSRNSKKKITGKTETKVDKQPGGAAVYIDVEFDRGLLYLVLVNGGDLPVEKVSVKFDKPLYGANGTDLSSLGIFKHLAFLAPRKQIRVFLDDTQAYYAKRQRSVVKFKLSWRIDRSLFTATITHDMRAYADITYIIEQSDNRRIGHVRS